MTKKTISEPISPTAITIEPTAADQPAQPAEPRIFDFTGPVELMDDLTKNVYYRLRRIAVMAKDGEFIVNEGRGDASRLPDGKTFTESQVIEILGDDYATGLVIDKKCCG